MAAGVRAGEAKWYPEENRWRIRVTNRYGERVWISQPSSGKKKDKRDKIICEQKADTYLAFGLHDQNSRVEDVYLHYLIYLIPKSKLPEGDLALVDWDKFNFSKVNETLRRRVSHWRAHLKPAYGKKAIGTLDEFDIEGVYTTAKDNGLRRKSIKNIRETQNDFLRYCRRKKLLLMFGNEIRIPSGLRDKKKPVLQPSHVMKLFSSDLTLYRGKVIRDPNIWFYRFGVIMGYRQSETHGLNWEDYDGKKITFARTVDRFGNVHDGYEGREEAGKNDNALEDSYLPLIARWILAEQAKFNPPAPGNRIFNLDLMAAVLQQWYRYCDYNGIPRTTLKEMRHACVSFLKDIPNEVLKRHIRHSKSMQTVPIYGHTIEGDGLRTATEVDKQFVYILPGLAEFVPELAEFVPNEEQELHFSLYESNM